MKRKKPPQDHTAVAPDSFTAQVIGHVRSPYKERFGTPRQPTVTAQTLSGARATPPTPWRGGGLQGAEPQKAAAEAKQPARSRTPTIK
jgi:hypothetical protein